MYECHGWFGLSESTYESDSNNLKPIIDELQILLSNFEFTNVNVALLPLNGQYFLTVTAFMNHKDSRAEEIEKLVRFIYQRLPGSYGLLYELDDETNNPPGRNAFRVRVVARGNIEERTDPFLSPLQTTIED